MSVEEHDIADAKRRYAIHIPNLHTHKCTTCPDDEDWPCPPFRSAKAVLLMAGVLQDKPMRPSI